MKILRDKETGVICVKAQDMKADKNNYVTIDNSIYQLDALGLEIVDVGNTDCEVQKHKYIDGFVLENEKYVNPSESVITLSELELLRIENIELKARLTAKEQELARKQESLDAVMELLKEKEAISGKNEVQAETEPKSIMSE